MKTRDRLIFAGFALATPVALVLIAYAVHAVFLPPRAQFSGEILISFPSAGALIGISSTSATHEMQVRVVQMPIPGSVSPDSAICTYYGTDEETPDRLEWLRTFNLSADRTGAIGKGGAIWNMTTGEIQQLDYPARRQSDTSFENPRPGFLWNPLGSVLAYESHHRAHRVVVLGRDGRSKIAVEGETDTWKVAFPKTTSEYDSYKTYMGDVVLIGWVSPTSLLVNRFVGTLNRTFDVNAPNRTTLVRLSADNSLGIDQLVDLPQMLPWNEVFGCNGLLMIRLGGDRYITGFEGKEDVHTVMATLSQVGDQIRSRHTSTEPRKADSSSDALTYQVSVDQGLSGIPGNILSRLTDCGLSVDSEAVAFVGSGERQAYLEDRGDWSGYRLHLREKVSGPSTHVDWDDLIGTLNGSLRERLFKARAESKTPSSRPRVVAWASERVRNP